jgi:hypothetical protein
MLFVLLFDEIEENVDETEKPFGSEEEKTASAVQRDNLL